MANAFKYSIGRKFIQAVSGAFLVVFLLLHMTINFFSVIDSFTGKFGKVAADHELFSKGDGLFQLGCDFMSTPIITVMVPVLALGFILHIAYGCYLSYYNMKARGGYKRYEVASKASADSWASTNMLVLGIVILGLLSFHMHHFWAHMQLKEFMGGHAENPYMLLTATFGNVFALILYIVWFCFIWFHLNHGFWSMFHTIGWSNQIWMKRLRTLGIVLSSFVWLGYVIVAINAFLQANNMLSCLQ